MNDRLEPHLLSRDATMGDGGLKQAPDERVRRTCNCADEHGGGRRSRRS